MAKTKLVRFNIKNLKYALLTAPKTYSAPVDLAYAVSIALEADYNETKIYGDGQVIAIIPDDKGKTGTLAVTNIEEVYEIACGRALAVSNATADIQQLNAVEHALYYEIEGIEDGVVKTIKRWIYGVISGKPNETYQQTEDDPTINPFEYPLTVLGQNIEALLSTDDYVNANGNTIKAWQLTSFPDDTNYATFGDTVPTPKSLV